ncbi:hypothetical protein [Pseudoxanthomonas japonensis]|uniref:hypothetical protein n=1 Tax=Pseudoxanthomonas japonensis TaxID=69284 RepID=UPI001BCF266F|nr:hypothetical protein [Pseudoxanthomonas japonensis]
MSAITLNETDIEDFDAALSLLYVAGSIEKINSIDDGVHLLSVCGMALTRLSNIRNRLTGEGEITLAETFDRGEAA